MEVRRRLSDFPYRVYPNPLRWVFLCIILFVRFCTFWSFFMRNFQFGDADIAVMRQSLMLRQAQLRRALNTETDSSILAIRRQQFDHLTSLIASLK